jgi:hypothetical protein
MSALEFKYEWENAPGVTDEILALTWARLEIYVDDRPVTRLVDHRSTSERTGVYGSIYPLAEWLVENWWSLLFEARRTAGSLSGRRLAARSSAARGWVRRHSMLAARSGVALPDLTIAREGDRVLAEWCADDDDGNAKRPVQFVSHGMALLDPESVRDEFRKLASAVVARIGNAGGEDRQRLSTNLSEVLKSQRDELDLCSRAARLGLDPYDAQQMTRGVVELLSNALGALNKEVVEDLLDGASLHFVKAAVEPIKAAAEVLRARTGESVDLTQIRARVNSQHTNNDSVPFQIGGRLADRVRSVFGWSDHEPLGSIEGLLSSATGWNPSEQAVDMQLGTSWVRGLVGQSASGVPVIVGPRPLSSSGHRFWIARGLHGLLTAAGANNQRVLTDAPGGRQAEGRAFAAELLAPSEGLRKRITDFVVTAEDVETLATEFGVDPLVVYHQIQNHRIAEVPDMLELHAATRRSPVAKAALGSNEQPTGTPGQKNEQAQ